MFGPVSLREVRATHQNTMAVTTERIAHSERSCHAAMVAIAASQQRLETSSDLLRRSAESSASRMTGSTSAAADDLIDQSEDLDLTIDDLIAKLKGMVPNTDKPAMLAGILLEGIVQTMLQRIPSPRRREMTMALSLLLCQRLGLLGVELK